MDLPAVEVRVIREVALHNSFVKDGILSVDFKLNKGLITLNFQGIDVFVESSGDVGYYIDVLVRSSWNHDKTLEIIEKDIHWYTWKHVVGQRTNGQEIVVLETSYDPIVKLLGEKETTTFMEWRRSQLEEVSSMLKVVEESTTKDHGEHVASSSNFHVCSNVLRHTPSGLHESTLVNIEGSANKSLRLIGEDNVDRTTM
ncbi:unnamed protein product [Sphagnum jensenii]